MKKRREADENFKFTEYVVMEIIFLFLKTVAMKNSIHYSKQNTANAAHVTAALASLGQQPSHSFAIAVFRPL